MFLTTSGSSSQGLADQKPWFSGPTGTRGLRCIPILILTCIGGADPADCFLGSLASGFWMIWSMGSPQGKSDKWQRGQPLLSTSSFGCQY